MDVKYFHFHFLFVLTFFFACTKEASTPTDFNVHTNATMYKINDTIQFE